MHKTSAHPTAPRVGPTPNRRFQALCFVFSLVANLFASMHLGFCLHSCSLWTAFVRLLCGILALPASPFFVEWGVYVGREGGLQCLSASAGCMQPALPHKHTLIEPILASFSSFLCATSIYFCLNIYKLQKKNSCNYIRAVFFYSCNCICIYMCICSCICICASVLGANVSDGVRVSCMCIICAWLPLGLCIANNANERIST